MASLVKHDETLKHLPAVRKQVDSVGNCTDKGGLVWYQIERRNFIKWCLYHPIYAVFEFFQFLFLFLFKIHGRIMRKWSKPHSFRKNSSYWFKANTNSLYFKYPTCDQICLPNFEKINFMIDTNQPLRMFDQYHVGDDIEDHFQRHRFGWIINFSDKKLASKEIVEHLLNYWLISPPLPIAPEWESYSASERVVNLLLWMSINQSALDRSFIAKSQEFVAKHLQWILTHLEYYGLRRTNNHLINNARALILGGVFLDASKPADVGINILQKMIPVLVGQDGFLRERSSHYQLIFTNWVFDCLHFLKSHKFASFLQFDLEDWARKLGLALSYLVDKNLNLASFWGDISPDITPSEAMARLTTLYPAFKSMLNEPKQGLTHLDDWCIVNFKKHTIFINFPIKSFPFSFVHHGHNDLTSFEWIYNGDRILVDSGRARYCDDEISILQIGPRGHNLLLVDGLSPLCSSFVPYTALIPHTYGHTKMHVETAEKADAITIELHHDGLKRGRKVKTHVRSIRVCQDSLEVKDQLCGRGICHLELIWHVNEAIRNVYELSIQSEIYNSSNKKIGRIGYRKGISHSSQEYATSNTASMLSGTCQVTLPVQIITTFQIKMVPACVE